MRPQFRDHDSLDRQRSHGGEFDPQTILCQARRLRAEAVADAARRARMAMAGALRRSMGACRRLLRAVADGIAAARRYKRLAGMSDAELAELGLTRGDVPRFALFRERPVQPGDGSGGRRARAFGVGDVRPVEDGRQVRGESAAMRQAA